MATTNHSIESGSKDCCIVINKTDNNDKDYYEPPSPPQQYEPLLNKPQQRSPLPTTKSDGQLNYSSNSLLVYRLNEMRSMEDTNFALALLCLTYCGMNMALIVINHVNSQEDDPVVSEKTFHLLEFWATFVFAIVECISLTSTPKSLLTIYTNPIVLRLVLFFNIVASSLPAILMTLNHEYFEIISHEIEYMNELTMSFVDLVLLWSLCEFEQGMSIILACIASLVSIVQLAVYNGLGRDEQTGDMIGEVPAHHLEFAFGIISSLIAFWFCMDNKHVCGKEIGEILYGTHRDCTICYGNSNDFAKYGSI